MIASESGWAPPRRRIFETLPEAIGATPLVRLRRIRPANGAEILLKMESENPMRSVKDRIARSMIEAAERDGRLTPETHIIEATSGNTGIALAFICAAKRYRLTLTMPESMSLERRALLRQMGAHLELTPADQGMKGAIERAAALYEAGANDGTAFIPQQFDNPANPDVHEKTTGPELWRDTGGKIDALVAGVGTGGTITGATRFIRAQKADFKTIAVEPTDSPVISGGEAGPHKIQGIGAGFVPQNLDVSLLDGVETVTNEEAFEWSRRLAQEEGILGGISTGANLCAAMRAASREEFAGKVIATVCCSYAERYLSTPLFDRARAPDLGGGGA